MKSLCKSSTMAIMIFVIMLISISFCFMANAMTNARVGDFDYNGIVDSDDAVHLLYYTLFGQDLYPVSGICDMNEDGVVDSKDAIYLLYHVHMPNEYPLPDSTSSGNSSQDKDQGFGDWVPLT